MRPTSTLITAIVLSLVSLPVLVPASVASATPQQDPGQTATEDILYLNDGRVFHGRLVSQDAREIIFEYVDRAANIRTTLTFRMSQVDRIERDVPVAAGAAKAAALPKPKTNADDEQRTPSFGTRRGAIEDEGLPLLYIVPMKGQMGTDINPDVYEKIIEDIRALDPDLLVIELECRDDEDRLYSRIEETEKGFDGSQFLDMYRKIANVFHDSLRDKPQVLWIHDSQGISSVLAMAWTDPSRGRHLLMRPTARLGGLANSASNFLNAAGDDNKLGKFREAYMAWLKGFAEYGDIDLDVIDAMVRPEFPLSATWRGRDVEWTLDRDGEYLVDDSEERTVDFTAKTAEDFCISEGTAETLDDLALLMRMREYRVADGRATAIFEDYTKDWRRAFEACKQSFRDYEKYMSWAGGADQLRYLGRARTELEKIVAAIDRYPPVEIRLLAEFGQQASRFNLVTQIEIMKEQIRALRQGRGAAGGGAAGGARGPAGAGGGGGRP